MRSRMCKLALVLGPFVLGAAPAAAVPIEDCLVCHADEELTLTCEDGDDMSLFVDEETYLASVHGETLVCTDCHSGYEDDHPGGREIASRRGYVIESYDLCKQCHFDTYTRTLESVHYEYLSEGLEVVPVCADCHGAHDIQDPREKSVMISRSCGTCHEDVYKVYKRSVHGAALSETNQDIPGCADCHTAHVIAHPDSTRFRLVSPETCMRCHGDPELTAKYGMLATVATTYLADFHGVTASLEADSEVEPEQVVVVCIDCHGYHDIASPSLVGEEEMARRVQAVCTSCHEDAAPGFSAAWLSHYPPNLERAPLVFLVRLFYRVFIPFMVAGLLLQIALHLYRVGSRR